VPVRASIFRNFAITYPALQIGGIGEFTTSTVTTNFSFNALHNC